MAQTFDPVTNALTGEMAGLLLLAAALTWPVAVALLALYQRAVRRSMTRRSGRTPQPEPAASAPAASTREAGGAPDVLVPLRDRVADRSHDGLLPALLSRPWRAAGVYAIAGLAYASILAVVTLRADGAELLPLRLLFTLWIFVWPLVLTVGIVAASARSEKILVTLAYMAGLAVVGAAAMARSPALTWAQIAAAWALFNLPATVLLLTYLSRRVRAVGPLVFGFMLLGLLGSHIVLSVTGSRDAYLRAAIVVAEAVGLGAAGALAGLVASGFLVFALIAWIALAWIRRLYEARLVSDESLTVDALWLLFAAAHGVGLAFSHPAWVLGAAAAFAGGKGTAWAGFRTLVPREQNPRTLLLLRSFAIGRDSERLFDAIEKHWRRVGSIQMIAGVDLARRTVEPHEFLDFVSGRLSRRFIDGTETLARRLGEMDTAPDYDGRFRVNDFFCYDDTWRMVFTRLAQDSDAVLMDLRGFSPANQGCVFEIRELVNVLPLRRVVFVVDTRTDEPFLRATVAAALEGMSPTSPNRAAGAPGAGVYHLDSLSRGELRRLLAALASAAGRQPTATAA